MFARIISLVCVLTSTAQFVNSDAPSDSFEDLILMRGAKPTYPDAYLCTGYKVEEDEAYIYKIEALANASTAHHMLLYGCNGEAYSNKDIWNCPPQCRDNTIMFAWAKNAPTFVMPKGVGLRVGRKTTISTIVLQVHYAKKFAGTEPADHSGIKLYKTFQKPQFVAGIYLLASSMFQVPPHKEAFGVDMSCAYLDDNSIFPFAFRTHAHGLGKVITGYMFNGTYNQIGKGNPQWPQAFYPANNIFEVKPGNFLAARCTYDSSNSNDYTHVGATGNDEMCNFYIMFYTDSSVVKPSGQCIGNQFPQLTGNNFPADVSKPLPPNPSLEEAAKGAAHHHHHHGPMTGGSPHQPEPQPEPSPSSNPSSTQTTHRALNSENFAEKPLVNEGGRFPIGHQNADWKQSVQNKHSSPYQETQREEEFPQFDLYDFDDIDSDDFSINKRKNHEYYTHYDANDLREKGLFGKVPEEGLSRNRNHQFDAMNQGSPQQPPPSGGRPKPQGPNGLPQPRPPQTRPPQPRPSKGQQPIGSGQARPAQKVAPSRHIKFTHRLLFNSSWQPESVELGQVGGLATDKDGNVYIFHRGSRIWDYSSFDVSNNFQYQNAPIEDDVVVIVDKHGNFIRKFGSGQYFMPHGITVDHENNIWLTDVALHQVFKIPAGESTPSLTLGHRFQHSEDVSYLCKPTDVAVLTSGQFYISDGYCNTRVVKYSKDGQVIKSWGERNLLSTPSPPPMALDVPHSLALSEAHGLVCVADREHGRIPCFDLDGNFHHMIQHAQFGPRLFAVEHCPLHGGILYAVNGPSFRRPDDLVVQGFTLDILTGELLETWNLPQGLKNPHDVTVDPASQSVYVGELDPHAVWKMTRVASMPTPADHHDHDDDHDDHDNDHHGHDENQGEAEDTAVPGGQQSQGEGTGLHQDQDKGLPGGSEASTLPSSANASSSLSAHLDTGSQQADSASYSALIGVMLVVPVVLILVIVLLARAHQAGKLKCYGGRSKRVFNLQGLLGNSHKGFDPLSTEESDHDDPEDSDHDEYTAPRKGKA